MELPLHAVVTALNHSDEEALELTNSIFAQYPSSSLLLDHERRPPLYYALQQDWGHENLSWLVDKSLETVLEKEKEGIALITHVVTSECPEELKIRLAVEAASRCIVSLSELLDGQHYESARRFCHRALLDFFAGVPKFPHTRYRDVLTAQTNETHPVVAVSAIKEILQQYVDTWGHFGPPVLQRDLPEEISPVIDSFVEVSLVAKGEPLTYHWFVQLGDQEEAIPIEGATQSFLFLSQNIQPHNEGTYYCEVENRRGRVTSTRMRVRVVDDRVSPDPTKKFVVDASTIGADQFVLRNLKAHYGGGVCHPQSGSTLTFLPNFFKCLDSNGNDVSDSHGVEIAIAHRATCESKLRLRDGERLVSCVVEVLPRTIGNLLRPATLWLPHCLASDGNNSGVVVEIDVKTGRILHDVGKASEHETQACVIINHLGTFAVISRGRILHRGEVCTDPPMERARLFIFRPKSISASLGAASMTLFIALVHDLPNCCAEAVARLHETHASPATNWVVDSFELIIRENFSLNLQLGGRKRVVFCWPSQTADISPTRLDVFLTDLDSSLEQDEILSPFILFNIRTVVSKTPIQVRRGVNADTKQVKNDEFALFEKDWTIPIPVLHDGTSVFGIPPPTPKLLRRTHNLLVLGLITSPSCDESLVEINEPQSEDDKEYSPYFYVVELAVFSPTFWQRYDQTWWFDKTKTAVIDGMYKVVHRGYDTKVAISTSAYAGCIRVARCSIDCFGSYSEPLLLTPLSNVNVIDEFTMTTPNAGWSIQLQETTYRARKLLNDLKVDNEILRSVYGLPCGVQNAVEALEEMKASVRSCNYELGLLLSGFKALERRVMNIMMARSYFVKIFTPFLLLQRAIPELDFSPVPLESVIQRLHELLLEAFEVVDKLSSPGWMQHFLMNEWFEDTMNNIFTSAEEVLEGAGNSLRSSLTLRNVFETPTAIKISSLMKKEQSYLLSISGRLEDTADQREKLMICRELGHVLQTYSNNSDNCASLNSEKLLEEFESSSTQKALATLRERDCLKNHLLCVTPSNNEKCVQVPEAVHFDLDTLIRGVNLTSMHLVIRVSNVTMGNCVVQAAEFERKSCYQITVREREILSMLGGALPERSHYVTYFSTPE